MMPCTFRFLTSGTSFSRRLTTKSRIFSHSARTAAALAAFAGGSVDHHVCNAAMGPTTSGLSFSTDQIVLRYFLLVPAVEAISSSVALGFPSAGRYLNCHAARK